LQRVVVVEELGQMDRVQAVVALVDTALL